MLKRTSGGDNDTELNELTVAPIRVPSVVTVVTTATPVGKSPRASRKLRSVKVIWRTFLRQIGLADVCLLTSSEQAIVARHKLPAVHGTPHGPMATSSLTDGICVDRAKNSSNGHANVCFWHKTDIVVSLCNVRFWGQSGPHDFRAPCLVLTHSGHR